jgi:hypothetical protein
MVDTLYASTTPETAPRYEYYVVDVVTNQVLAQIPFEDVSYERRLRDFGAFDGKITVTAQTENLDLYNSTMPGKTALYVVRNGVCVWGGIIWGRTYDLQGRSLALTAAEFTSYLSHRNIWKTYSFKFTAELTKTTKTSPVKISIQGRILKKPLPVTDEDGNANKVYVSFSESDLVKYSGYYAIYSLIEPTQTVFYVQIPKLPARAGTFPNVTISAKADTYDYVRDLLKDMLVDFKDTQFANETIAPGIKIPNIVNNILVSGNTVTLTTEEAHGLVSGQVVDVFNMTKAACGAHLVKDVPTTTTFTYKIPVLSITHVERTDNEATVYFDTSETATTQINPYIVGATVTVDASVNTFDNASAVITGITENSITYVNTGTVLSKTAATGSITIPNLASTPVSRNKVTVYSRQINSTSSKNIAFLKRISGVVTIWTARPHGFSVGDNIIMNSKTYPDLNNDGLAITVTSVKDTYKFQYSQPTKTASSKNIVKDGTQAARVDVPNRKNSVKLAVAIKKLRIYTQATHQFDIDELIYVRGVDSIKWQRSIWDGYHTIADLDTSKESAGAEVLTVTHIETISGTAGRLYLNKSHGITDGDKIKVSDVASPRLYYNGKFTVTDVYDPDDAASGVAWIQYNFAATTTATGAKTAVAAGKVVPFGSAWFDFVMPEYGTVTEPENSVPITNVTYKPSNRHATFTTEAPHYISAGDYLSVGLSGDSNKYLNGSYTVLGIGATGAIDGSEAFTVKIPASRTGKPTARVNNKAVTGSFTRDKTLVAGVPTLTVPLDRIGRKNNVATVYSVDHDFTPGNTVTIDLTSAALSSFENNGEVVEITSTTANYFQYSSTGSDYGVSSISTITSASSVATATTSSAHGYLVGQEVTISGVNASHNGTKEITDLVGTTGFKYAVASTVTGTITPAVLGDWTSYSTKDIATAEGYAYLNFRPLEDTYDITNIASASNTATVTAPDHGFEIGDYVSVFIPGKTYTAFNNNNTSVNVTAVTDNTFSYVPDTSTGTVSPAVAINGYATYAATAMTVPVAIARSYGEFPGNANIAGLEFSTGAYSGTQFASSEIRGSDMVTVAEHLERYTNTKDGFDYRIDCSLVDAAGVGKVFKRTFTFVPRVPDSLTAYLNSLPGDKLERGTYAPANAFGADQLVFEYPGNVQNVSMAESAQDSATRVFVVGNNSDLGPGASARYSASSDTELLNAGWPILDRVEKIEWPLVGVNMINVDNWGNYDSEADMEKTAERFLRESRPPVGDFIITVNGSLSPEVGTFDPGDWCSLVVNDPFVRQRLDSPLEPRKDVIVRRIDGIRVQVPNNPAFPEMIDLDLVTEWQVDKVGQ